MTPEQLIEMARERCDPPTWYRLSKELGVKEGVLHGWRHGKGSYSDDAAFRLAEMLGLTFLEVVAMREAHREKDEERRNRWLERLGKRAAMVSGILVSSLIYHSASEGRSRIELVNSLPTSCAKNAIDTLRIMRRWLRQQREGFARFPGLRPPSAPGCPALP